MDLTSQDLAEALAVISGERSEDLAEVVEIARKAEPNFTPTLYSAWRNEGLNLSPALREELDAVSRRVDFYRSVAARLRAEVDNLTTVKGLEVAALYPPGLVRYMNDLDFITFSEPDLWRAVSLLKADGWIIETGTFTTLGGSLKIMVSMRMPAEDPFRLAYGVEFATYYTLGNQGGIPPIVRMPERWLSPPVKNTIMLLHESYEQPFRARDVVDTALLHRVMQESDRRALREAVVELNLVLPYAAIIKLVNQAGLGPIPPVPGGALTVARSRAARLARGVSFFTQPVAGTGRHLQRRLMMANPGRAEKAIWGRVEQRLHPADAVQAGLFGFGLPLAGPAPDVTQAVLRRRDDYAWVDTPAVRFLLTVGDYVSETAVDELSGGEGQADNFLPAAADRPAEG